MKNIFRKTKRIAHRVGEFSDFVVRLWEREKDYYKTKPREALFFLTYRCSSRCQVCEMWKREKDYEEMDLNGWKKAVDMVAELGIDVIYLFGGDVLLKREILFPLAKYIVQKGICCDITTNGNLLNKEIAKKLVETGVYNIGVSIDAVGDLHDHIRGVKGMFKRATQGIKAMLDARGNSKGPIINIFCTISNLNINEFHKVLPYAIELGVNGVHFEPYGEMTREAAGKSIVNGIAANPYFVKQDKSLLLNKEQARYSKEKIADIEREAKGIIGLDIHNYICLGINELSTGTFQHKRCYMARYHINVDPSGYITPCLFFQNYHLGNVQDIDINRIWGNKIHKEFLDSQNNHELKICQQCIVGVQRNPTAWQKLFREINSHVRGIKNG